MLLAGPVAICAGCVLARTAPVEAEERPTTAAVLVAAHFGTRTDKAD